MSSSAVFGQIPFRTPHDEVREILSQVAEDHGVSVDQIKGDRRMHRIILARQEAMYRLRRLKTAEGKPRFSFPRIGQIVGGRDHTTVIWACRAHEQRLAQ